jgi:hypothetical protein
MQSGNSCIHSLGDLWRTKASQTGRGATLGFFYRKPPSTIREALYRLWLAVFAQSKLDDNQRKLVPDFRLNLVSSFASKTRFSITTLVNDPVSYLTVGILIVDDSEIFPSGLRAFVKAQAD